MNAQHDQLESLLETELRDRAGDVRGSWLSFQDVRGRATTIRRRRRIGAGIAVAAALAIAVPLGMTATGALNRADEIPPAVPSPTEVVRTTLTLDGLERGDAPEVEYFTPDGVVLPEAGLQPLSDSWQALVPSDGGWLGLSPSRDEVVDLTEDFQRTSARTITQTFVSSPDRSMVAWTFPESGAQTLTLRSTTDPGDGATWDFPETPLVDPVDFVGERSLLFQTTSQQDGSHEIGIAHEDGTTTSFDGRFVKAISANPHTGLVAVQTRANPDASACAGVVNPATSTSETVWDTCDYTLGAFSPDGRYVIATDPYLSGIGITSLSVLDAGTGDLVTTFEQPDGGQVAVNNVVWESPDTIVAVGLEGPSATILRFGVDGSLEETIDGTDGFLGDQAFYLGHDRLRGF